MGSKRTEHSEALELIGYGLAKFSGSHKRSNEIANRLSKNRNAFFQRLVDVGMAKSTNAVSNRQDYYDPFFGIKAGRKTESSINLYKPRKERLDSVIGHLDLNQYVDFIEAIIASETGAAVDEKMLQLINAAKLALSDNEPAYVPPIVVVAPGEGQEEPLDTPKDEGEKQKSKRLHAEVQWVLKQLGFLTGCKVFIAINDGSKQYKGEPLSQGCIAKLPKQGMSDSQHKRASLIDVVWVKDNKILFAYEVECTTTIYSGILRMSDLAYSMQYNAIKGIIIAPNARIEKVVEELNRPTFSNQHIKDCMRYYAVEELFVLYKSLKEAGVPKGTINPNILWEKSHIVQGEDG